LAVVLAVVGGGPWLSGCRSRRSVPLQNGDTVVWQGGSVSVWDYSYDPGGYENHIEWTGPNGKREQMAYVGDVDAELKLLPDGRLQASFYDENSRRSAKHLRLIILTWRDRRTPPIKVELNQ
jgi:hypothetical protein